MKKLTVIVSLLLAAALVLAGTAAKRKDRADCLRLHVIANSDSPEDQSAKLAVRDAILACVREDFEAEDADSARLELMAKGSSLQDAAEKALSERGMDYGAQLVSGEFDFPDRDYCGELYPAGRYEALRVILGDGEGQNWWCVMFPPLCLIETEDEKAEFNEDGTLVFKSRIWEFIKEVFGI